MRTQRFIVLAALLHYSGLIAAEPAAAPPDDPEAQAAKVVAELLQKESLGKWSLDDALAKEVLRGFIARLDPHQLIFLQSDWAEFREHEKLLDDQIKAGDLSLVKRVFDRFNARTGTAHELAMRALEQKHDWTTDEAWPFPYADFAADKAALAERWRLRLKGEILFEKANGSSLDEAVAFLRGRYETNDLYRRCLTEDFLQSSLIDQLCKTCDREQMYFSPELESYFSDRRGLGPKYSLNLGFIPRLDRSAIAPAQQGSGLPIIGLAGFPVVYGWDLVAIRTSDGPTHHLVGTSNYELWALSRAGIAFGDSPEVILELQHPTTMQRKSIAWQQAEKKNRLTVFYRFPSLSPRPRETPGK